MADVKKPVYAGFAFDALAQPRGKTDQPVPYTLRKAVR